MISSGRFTSVLPRSQINLAPGQPTAAPTRRSDTAELGRNMTATREIHGHRRGAFWPPTGSFPWPLTNRRAICTAAGGVSSPSLTGLSGAATAVRNGHPAPRREGVQGGVTDAHGESGGTRAGARAPVGLRCGPPGRRPRSGGDGQVGQAPFEHPIGLAGRLAAVRGQQAYRVAREDTVGAAAVGDDLPAVGQLGEAVGEFVEGDADRAGILSPRCRPHRGAGPGPVPVAAPPGRPAQRDRAATWAPYPSSDGHHPVAGWLASWSPSGLRRYSTWRPLRVRVTRPVAWSTCKCCDTALGVTLRRRAISTVGSGSSSRYSSRALGAPRSDVRAVASAVGTGAHSVATPRLG